MCSPSPSTWKCVSTGSGAGALPGFTATDFHRQMGSKEMQKRRLYWMEPDDVVGYSMKCLERGKVICVPGLVNRLLRALIAIVPRKMYYRVTEANQ